MSRAIVGALRSAASWSLPAILTQALVALAPAMISAVHRTSLRLAEVGPKVILQPAPASAAEALALHAHAVTAAILVVFLRPVAAMQVLAVLPIELVWAIACGFFIIPFAGAALWVGRWHGRCGYSSLRRAGRCG